MLRIRPEKLKSSIWLKLLRDAEYSWRSKQLVTLCLQNNECQLKDGPLKENFVRVTGSEAVDSLILFS